MGIYERLGRKRPAPKGAAEPETAAAGPFALAGGGRKSGERKSPITAVPPPPEAPAAAPAPVQPTTGRKATERKSPVAATAPPPEAPAPAPAQPTTGRKTTERKSAVAAIVAVPPPATNVGATVGRKLAALKLNAAPPAPAPAPTKHTPLSTANLVMAAPNPKGVDLGLQRELSQLLMDDNYSQIAMRELMKRFKLKSAEEVRKRAELPEVRKLKELDDKRIKRLKEILAKYGWPGKNLVGEQGSHEIWLIVQHADHDRNFQKHALKLMAEAVAKKEASEQDFAYLTDRVRCGENQRQIYGTQLYVMNGEPSPKPIEDEGKVNERRQSIGLASLADYVRHAREEYKRRRR